MRLELDVIINTNMAWLELFFVFDVTIDNIYIYFYPYPYL